MRLEESWGFQISKIGQEMDRRFSKILEPYAISSREYGVLLTIHEQTLLTQLKIGELNKLDRTTIGQLVDHLEAKGFLQRQKNPKDRRQNLLELTEAGQNLVREMWHKMQAVEVEVIQTLPDRQKETLLSIVERLKENEHE
ncbi:MarR family winged helix-turn-helix transcriptional regulator [Streptococcus caballi]|uniref:MarR family winged helix-turn-helix transcriptional regulator n=1 Tax=Streptococcus caballi TaxID=439220 RepID=UPI0003810FC0|nr:MarR family transcriptional regulator [Streptococcus caballi]